MGRRRAHGRRATDGRGLWSNPLVAGDEKAEWQTAIEKQWTERRGTGKERERQNRGGHLRSLVLRMHAMLA